MASNAVLLCQHFLIDWTAVQPKAMGLPTTAYYARDEVREVSCPMLWVALAAQKHLKAAQHKLATCPITLTICMALSARAHVVKGVHALMSMCLHSSLCA